VTRLDIRVLIDRFLATDKTLVGASDWQPDQNGALRWRVNVAVAGEIRHGFALEVKAYPELGRDRFRIILMAEKAIWRLDCADDAPHNNPLSGPADIREQIIKGPHYHSWADNRRFATAKALPNELHIARVFEGCAYRSAFRWFCSETGIAGIPSLDLPELPRSGRLV
jgi:hypothetical protein